MKNFRLVKFIVILVIQIGYFFVSSTAYCKSQTPVFKDAMAQSLEVLSISKRRYNSYELVVKAVASEGYKRFEYKFLISKNDTYSDGWDTVKSWSESSQQVLIINKAPGKYHLMVYVRNYGSMNVFDDSRIIPFDIIDSVITSKSRKSVGTAKISSFFITSAPKLSANGDYTLTASVVGKDGTGQYEYLYKVSNYSTLASGFEIISNWSELSERSLSIKKTSGSYHLLVYIRNVGSQNMYEDYRSQLINVAADSNIDSSVKHTSPPEVSSLKLTSHPKLLNDGTYIFTVSTSGIKGTGEYEYLYKISNDIDYRNGWKEVSQWSSAKSQSIYTKKKPGNYNLMVYIRSRGSDAGHEGHKIIKLVLPKN